MVKFFFYNKFKNVELIKKINNQFDISDGYVIVKNYNSENNLLEISDKSFNNNKILYGKIVNFNMTIEDIIKKINKIEDFKIENKTKYYIKSILTNKTYGDTDEAFIFFNKK
jgi:hypothetical protein